MKKTLIILGLVLALIIILAGTYLLVMKSVMNRMKPVETGHVTGNIFAIKDSYVNVYLVRADSGYIMIDAGNSQKKIEKGLAELKIAREDISALFLTHTDGDHVASIPLFPHAQIFLSSLEEQLINGETPRFVFFGNNIKREDYELLEDGQELSFAGVLIKGISTPGHTAGSMCYLVDGKYLFTGDVLKLINGKVEEFHHFINMNTETDIKSIEKLGKLEGVEYILTAHYGVSNDFKEAFSDWYK
jgi:hydroxyacylglutathione hydrolase